MEKALIVSGFFSSRKPRVRGGTLSWRCVVWWLIWIWDGLGDNYCMGIPENA